MEPEEEDVSSVVVPEFWMIGGGSLVPPPFLMWAGSHEPMDLLRGELDAMLLDEINLKNEPEKVTCKWQRNQ